MKKLLLYLLFVPIALGAQINESDTLDLKAKLSVTGFRQGGNVETVIFRAKTDLSFKPSGNWVFKTQNSYIYQEFGKQKADEDILSLNFLSYKPHKRIYPLVLGFLSTNFRREIDLRYLVGGGVTFQIINNKNNWLKFSLSSEYEHTDFDNSTFNIADYNGQRFINTFRGTLWVNGKYNLFQKKLILTHETYFQPSLEEANNYRWRADLGLEMPVMKYLNFKINYLYTFESIVIENQHRVDSMLTFGLTVKNF